MPKKYYITTPLYYVNSPLTIGGAYTTIVADVLARYQRLQGRDVFFLTGSDEHGQKIKQAAEEKGMSPKSLADQVVGTFLELWDLLEITHSDFIRTTETRHEEVVKNVFRFLLRQGDIYWGKYEGWYCTPCETFLLESQLVEDKCPECGRPVEKLVEENYFFRLSRFQKKLEDHFHCHPDFIRPASRFREMANRLQKGLNDVCVSRSVSWGIPVPGPKTRTIWVWFDALLNYISAVDAFPAEGRLENFWPADLHLMAKDILWFHCILWPGMLLALGYQLPHQVFAHGWWTMGGGKISKSKGEKVYAREAIEKYGSDPVRYFMLREIPLGGDGDFSWKALNGRYRSDLANDLGNLLQRSLSMIEKYRNGRLPPRGREAKGTRLLEELVELYPSYHRLMSECSLSLVLELVWSLVRKANRYIEESKPWILWRDEKSGQLDGVLFALATILIHLAGMLQPFMPGTAREICRQVQPHLSGPPDFKRAAGCPAELLRSGCPIGQMQPLFPLERAGEIERA